MQARQRHFWSIIFHLVAQSFIIATMSILSPYLLKRHPLAVAAHFDFVIVLTYAFPAKLLAPLVAPGLILDTYNPQSTSGARAEASDPDNELAFIAVAAVSTEHMRPKGLPDFIGQNYMLIGYRIFVRYLTLAGQRLRGLQILRSDVNSSMVAATGNIMTHYNFHKVDMRKKRSASTLSLKSYTSDNADLSVSITLPEIKAQDVQSAPDMDELASSRLLPAGSPFPTVREALKFAGPMPFTFDYEKQTNSIIRVEGVRDNWHPQPVSAEVEKVDFFRRQPFNQVSPLLSSAFYIADVPYYWKKGITEGLDNRPVVNTEAKV